MKKSAQQNTNTPIDELKSIRKEKKMSVESVAGMMKVSRDYVRYIEASQFEKLGAPTFLRGHITNYCKALGLDPVRIISQVPDQFLKHQNLKTSNAMGASPLARVKRQSNHFGKYAIGTALLGMLCLSFYFVWDKWSLPQDTRSINNIAITNVENDDDKKITYSSLIPQVTGPVQNKTINEQKADQIKQADEAVSEPVTDDNQYAEDEEVINDEAEDQLLAAEIDTASTESKTVNKYAIKLALKEQTWVSIKTQQGENIIHDLLNPGMREFESNEPIKFRIGNADQIELFINEQNIELAPHTEKEVVDFVWPLDTNS